MPVLPRTVLPRTALFFIPVLLLQGCMTSAEEPASGLALLSAPRSEVSGTEPGNDGKDTDTLVTSAPEVPALPAPNKRADTPSQESFATCLFEAQSLLKLNKTRYAADVKALYDTLSAAKYYASVSSGVSGGVYSTITPYYRYRINDLCNTVSHLLLNEFKRDQSAQDSRNQP